MSHRHLLSGLFFRYVGSAFVLLLISITLTPLRAAQGFAVGSLDLKLTGPLGWFEWYNSSDSPEGAYLGTVYETVATQPGTVQLGRTLSPGRYYVSWKVLDYGAKGSLEFSIGGGLASSVLNSADSNGQWTDMVIVDVPVASSSIQFSLRRSMPLSVRQIFLLRGLYITPSPSEMVFADDSVQDPSYPKDLDTRAERKGNILENASFEVGIGHGWGLGEGSARDFSVASLWDSTVGYEGSCSLKVPRLNELVSRPYTLRGNRAYTLSAWIKTATYGSATLTVYNCGSLPTNFPPTTVLTKTFPLVASWQRISLSGILLDYPTSEYYFRLKVNDPQGGFTWVDAIQWEEGSLTDYASGQSLEVGLVSAQPSNLFYEDEPVTMQLSVRNSSGTASPASIPFEIYDYLNRRVGGGITNVVVPARSRWSATLNLGVGQKGTFRVVLWAQDVDHTREEVVYGVVPRPQQLGLDTNSIIGIHANFTEFQADVLQKMGVKWNRASSPSRAFRWSSLQPTDGPIQWSPDDVSVAISRGISVLGTLGLEWPTWADVGGVPNLDKWENFVEAVVLRYKDRVKYWEVWNEPQWQMSAPFYTQLLQRAILAARRADPAAQIVGVGGVYTLSFATNVLALLGTNGRAALSAVSTHIYPKNAAADYTGFRQNVRDAYGLPVWNTEAGVWDRGFYTAENSDYLQIDYTWPQKGAARYDFGHRGAAEVLAYGFLNNVGNGLTKYFYYDARIYVGPGANWSHSTIFEYDDTIRAKGVAYTVLAWLFDHSVGLGEISPHAASSMYLFDRNGNPLVSVWSRDRTNRSLTLNLGASSYKVYDCMGNVLPITGGRVRYGATPLYIEGQGITVSTLRTAVQAGTIAVEPDVTAPNLAMVIYPTGPTVENPVKFRWLALDETSSTADPNPKSMQYSYSLTGFDTAWSPWSSLTYIDYFDLPAGAYQLQVKARDAAGNVSSISRAGLQVGSGIPLPPGAPAGLAATSGIGQILLRWQPSVGATSYRVKRSLNGGGPYTLLGSPGALTSYVDTSVQNGTTYFYVVSSLDGTGEGANSSPVSATSQLPSLPVISIIAADPVASESGTNHGTFTITRSGTTTTALTVNFTVGGTAIAGSDYLPLGTAVSIPAGATSVTLTLVPVDDSLPETDKLVAITLANNNSYTVGPAASASAVIQDNDFVIPEGVQGYVTGRVLGTLRNDYSGFVGMKIVVGAAPITISALGRIFVTGNRGTHVLKLVSAANGIDVPRGMVLLSMSGGNPGVFKYASLGSPIQLAAGGVYYVASQEFAGGDQWYDYNSSVATTTAAVAATPAYQSAGGSWVSFGAAGQAYGPVDFRYTGATVPDRAYVTSKVLGPLRNDYSGFVGMRIVVGTNPITLTALGRISAPGNGGVHFLKVVNAGDYTDVPGGSVSLSMSGGIPGEFEYVHLSNPIFLGAGQSYYVVSKETLGGDYWHDYNSIVATTSVAAELSPVYQSLGGKWVHLGSARQSYGPVDFKYRAAPPSESPFITGKMLGALRNDFDGFVGMRIAVGSSPISVTALGRIGVAGNNGTHIVKLVRASDRVDLEGGAVSVSMIGSIPGEFAYSSLASPVMLAARTTYYLASEEEAGGDAWHDYYSTMTTTGAAVIQSTVYSPGPGVWVSYGTLGHGFGPLDFKFLKNF